MKMVNFVYSPVATESATRKLCNGQYLLIADYPELFAAFGNAFGGDGITDFRLPNLLNRFLVAAGEIPANTFGGSATFTLSKDNLPAHTHGMSITVKQKANALVGNTNVAIDAFVANTGGLDREYNTATDGTYMAPAQVDFTMDSTGGSLPVKFTPLAFATYVFVETV